MSIEDRLRWDARHRDPSALSPRESVVSLPRAKHGNAVALDVGCGQGRHAGVLREVGYAVVAMDVSAVALRHLLASRPRDEWLLAVQADIDAWPFAAGVFDLVVQVDFLDRALFPVLAGSLRAGGLLLIDTFLDAQRPNAEGPTRSEFLLQPGELPREFGALEILRYDESAGATARATMLARSRGARTLLR